MVVYEPKAQMLRAPLVVFLPTEPEQVMPTALGVPAGAADAKPCRCFARALRPGRMITDGDDCASLKCV